jgi:UDP-glucose 4-epimerase
MKKILIFGGSGYIGMNLALSLSNDFQLTITGRRKLNPNFKSMLFSRNIKFKKVNILNFLKCKNLIDDHDEVLFLIPNLQPHDSKPLLHSDFVKIVLPTRLIFSYAAFTKKRIIFSSSGGAIYGNNYALSHLESDSPKPTTKYGHLKLDIENQLIKLGSANKINNVSIRISNPYGGTFDNFFKRGFINSLLRSVQNSEEVEVWGSGEQIRDFVHINDLISFFKLVLDAEDLNGIFNCGTGIGFSLNQIIQIVENAIGEKVVVSRNLNYIEPISKNVLNIDKAKTFIGWAPKIDLENGIKILLTQF